MHLSRRGYILTIVLIVGVLTLFILTRKTSSVEFHLKVKKSILQPPERLLSRKNLCQGNKWPKIFAPTQNFSENRNRKSSIKGENPMRKKTTEATHTQTRAGANLGPVGQVQSTRKERRKTAGAHRYFAFFPSFQPKCSQPAQNLLYSSSHLAMWCFISLISHLKKSMSNFVDLQDGRM